jgi:hypothetical protein
VKKAHQNAIEEALTEIETYLVHVDDRRRQQLRLLLRRLVRRCLIGQGPEQALTANDAAAIEVLREAGPM